MKPHETVSKIKLRTLDGHASFEPTKIVRFEADKNYVLLYQIDQPKPERIHYRFVDIEKFIVDNEMIQFFKCHRSHIVNLDHIKRFKEKARTLVTEQGEIPISEDRLDDFRDIFCS